MYRTKNMMDVGSAEDVLSESLLCVPVGTETDDDPTGRATGAGVKFGVSLGISLIVMLGKYDGIDASLCEGETVVEVAGLVDGAKLDDNRKLVGAVTEGRFDGFVDIIMGVLVIGTSAVGIGATGIGTGIVAIGGVVDGANVSGDFVGINCCWVDGQISDAASPFDTDAIDTVKMGGSPSCVIVPITSARNPFNKAFSLSLVQVLHAGYFPDCPVSRAKLISNCFPASST
jgi:hypothetical protein